MVRRKNETQKQEEKDDSHKSNHKSITSYRLLWCLVIEASLKIKNIGKKIGLLYAVFHQDLNLHKEVNNAEPKIGVET